MVDKATPGKPAAADKLTLKIAISNGDRGHVKNVTRTWPALIESLSTPAVDNVKRKAYNKLPIKEQNKLKNRGYIVGGHFEDGVRRIDKMDARSVLILDMDRMSVEQYLDHVKPGNSLSFLAEYEYFCYTTRSHTPEKPRLRVVVPLIAPVPLDLFAAASRLVAYKLDPTMDLVDPVSFRPAQIMYKPSMCEDDEFVCFHNYGRLLDANGDLIDHFEKDWRVNTNLPRGERDNVRQAGGKAEHPSSKRGVVGAYCRARDILSQMNLMRDLYEPVEDIATPLRWSWIKGSVSDGVMLYLEDDRMMSWHSTDPAADKNLNAFDLERIHRFGHLDTDDNSMGLIPPQDMPSYKALAKAIQDDPVYDDVRREYTAMSYDQDVMADDAEFDADLEDEPAPVNADVGARVAEAPAQKVTSSPVSDEDLLALLDTSEKGAVKPTVNNLILILTHDPRFRGAFRFNEFLQRVVQVRPIGSKALKQNTGKIKSGSNGDRMTDDVRTMVRQILSAPNTSRGEGAGRSRVGWGVNFGDEEVARAIERVAKQDRFHPVCTYLKAVRWDGVDRVTTFFSHYFHVKHDAYHDQVANIMLTGAVARVFEPGCKLDCMLVLESTTQGTGKSSTARFMAVFDEWFGQFMADLTKNERVIENVIGKWIIEWPELSSMSRADAETIKAIISSGTLSGRLAFRREEQDFPLQSIFIGSTNNEEYLKDKTGNRRYLPVRIPDGKRIDIYELKRDIAQIWAQSYQNYLWMRRMTPTGDLPFELTGEALVVARIKQGARVIRGEEEVWDGLIREFMQTRTTPDWANGDLPSPLADDEFDSTPESEKLLPHRFCVASIAVFVLGLDHRNLHKLKANAIASTLDGLPELRRVSTSVRFKGFGKQRAWVYRDL